MIKFGTGGWRAIIADDFTKANIRLLTAGLCELMLKEGHAGAEICVGYDRRFLSKESAHWAAEVLAGYGFRVYMVNRSSPTPLMMFVVKTHGMPYGMAVTASHNPAIYNGIKVFTAGGRDAEEPSPRRSRPRSKSSPRPTSGASTTTRRWPIEPSANIIRPTSILTASWPR